MKILKNILFLILLVAILNKIALCQVSPEKINFVRQGVQRMIFDENQSILLAKLEPNSIIGLGSMYPVTHYSEEHASIIIHDEMLVIQSKHKSRVGIWFGGFNPFATYSMLIDSCYGNGKIGFKFSDGTDKEQFVITIGYNNSNLTGVNLRVTNNSEIVVDKSIADSVETEQSFKGKVILQMLGSGLTLYLQEKGLPPVIAHCDFNSYIDLRNKKYLNSFQSHLFVQLNNGQAQVKKVEMTLTTGVGLADIRAITYENGDPLLDQGRLWYTMSIRGRDLPHHIQGVFSMDPTVFDLKLEGVILFDLDDGLLRNEIASHIFYNRKQHTWHGITTGFSSFANPDKEKKQLLAVESKRDPRFGFSIMKAVPLGMVGDFEDPHIIFDSTANKWRMLTCENRNGYKAIVLESDSWDKNYIQISGPVSHDATGKSIQKIGDKLYCFSGSSRRKIFIYTYPDLIEAGTLKMDLPPWDETAGTRVWPNVVELPEGYPFKYVALMMDRYNYPGLNGPNWSYGALYLYHGY